MTKRKRIEIRADEAEVMAWSRQAAAEGVGLSEWVRARLNGDQQPDIRRSEQPSDQPDPIERPAADRIAALASLPGLRRGSELAPPPKRTPAERQRLDATVTHQLQAGTEPDVIVARLAGQYTAPEIRAAIARRDSAA